MFIVIVFIQVGQCVVVAGMVAFKLYATTFKPKASGTQPLPEFGTEPGVSRGIIKNQIMAHGTVCKVHSNLSFIHYTGEEWE